MSAHCASEPPPLPFRAGVEFFLGERRAARRAARRLLGRPLEDRHLAALGGGDGDAAVQVGTLRGHLYLEVRGTAPSAYRMVLVLRRRRSKTVLVCEDFQWLQTPPDPTTALADRLARLAARAARLGIDRIEFPRHRRRRAVFSHPARR